MPYLLALIELSAYLVVTWFIAICIVKSMVNKKLLSKGIIEFSKFEVLTITENSIRSTLRLRLTYGSNEIITLVGVDANSCNVILQSKDITLRTYVCMYGILIPHIGFRLMSIEKQSI